MNKLFPLLALCTALGLAQRPPAYPLITHDPYFSIWSTTDELNGGPTRHWTGAPQEIGSLIRIDGATYRLMGSDPPRRPAERTEPLRQVSAQVLPTRTIYRFEGAGVGVTLTFLTPALLKDLDVLSRPATYVRWDVRILPAAAAAVLAAQGGNGGGHAARRAAGPGFTHRTVRAV